jgi:hypothetical protein
MSTIFPENDWEEKDVNQVALGSAGSKSAQSSACDIKSAAACGDTDLTNADAVLAFFNFRPASYPDTLAEFEQFTTPKRKT